MALFILGFVAGRLFSSPSGGVGVLVVALLVGAGAGASMDPKSPAGIAQDHGLTVAPARVGTISAIRWRTAVPGGGEPGSREVPLRVVRREKGREIFRLKPVPTGGTLNLAFQFTDASAHEVTVTAFGPGPEDRTETTRIVHVDSATPSLGIRTRPVVLFLLVVTAGLAAGRISKRRRHPLR